MDSILFLLESIPQIRISTLAASHSAALTFLLITAGEVTDGLFQVRCAYI